MTKRQEIAQETRRKIYTTACSLIEGKGFANVSVEDITRACGVAKGGVELCRQWVREVINPADSPGEMCGDKYAYDHKRLTAFLRDAVKDGLLKKNTPVDTLVHLFMCELYGMMTCWCMSDTKFEPEEWVGRFAKLQLPAILKPYERVSRRLHERLNNTKGTK